MPGMGRGRGEVGETVASFPTYEGAQKAVSSLVESDVPARDIAIVGNGLRSVERVTGKLGYATAARQGAINGLLLGLFFSAIFVLGNSAVNLSVFIGVLFVGVALGMLLSIGGYAIVRRRRDFASVTQVIADHYEVTVLPTSIHRAREVLGGQAAAATPPRPPSQPSGPPQFGQRTQEPPRYGQRAETPPQHGQRATPPLPQFGQRVDEPPRFGQRVNAEADGATAPAADAAEVETAKAQETETRADAQRADAQRADAPTPDTQRPDAPPADAPENDVDAAADRGAETDTPSDDAPSREGDDTPADDEDTHHDDRA
ncbi:general stress protein [Microbacterium horticulturae]|uniref:general stress protein n=1 Tax=Microbacterium horticulturae TaxID=3028316 RepID=UPI0031B610F0